MLHGLRVVLGTGSEIKLRACQEALPGAIIVPEPRIQSAVPEQPVGEAETSTGAIHRARSALQLHPDSQIAIGIENGLILEESRGWVDRACVAAVVRLSGRFDTEFVAWSEAIDVPSSAIFEPERDTGPKPLWSPHKDPHFEICGISRVEFLADAIRAHIVPRIVNILV